MARRLPVGTACILVFAASASAHPGDGIVAAEDGTVLFSDVERNVIWKATAEGELTALARGLHSHSIGIDSDGQIYAEHLSFVAGGSPGRQWSRSFFRISPDGSREQLIEPTFERRIFGGSPFAAESGGAIVSLTLRDDGSRVFLRWDTAGQSQPILRDAPPHIQTDIGGICARPGGGYVFTQEMKIMGIDGSGAVSLLADLSKRDPGPTATSLRVGQLWGVACAADGTIYAADWDARSVHRLGNDGALGMLLTAEGAWSPTGVATGPDGVYVLEHGLDGEKNLGPRVRVVEPSGATRLLVIVE